MGKERRERRALTAGGTEAPAGIDNTARRTWNKDDYAEKAASREAKVLLGEMMFVIFKSSREPWGKNVCFDRKSKMRRVRWMQRRGADLVREIAQTHLLPCLAGRACIKTLN